MKTCETCKWWTWRDSDVPTAYKICQLHHFNADRSGGKVWLDFGERMTLAMFFTREDFGCTEHEEKEK